MEAARLELNYVRTRYSSRADSYRLVFALLVLLFVILKVLVALNYIGFKLPATPIAFFQQFDSPTVLAIVIALAGVVAWVSSKSDGLYRELIIAKNIESEIQKTQKILSHFTRQQPRGLPPGYGKPKQLSRGHRKPNRIL
jgi:hypothetical protein